MNATDENFGSKHHSTTFDFQILFSDSRTRRRLKCLHTFLSYHNNHYLRSRV